MNEPTVKQKFEEIYSLSIRRGEDSNTVLEWVRDHLRDEKAKFKTALKESVKQKFKDHGYHIGKKEYVSMTEKQFLELINTQSQSK